MEEKKTPWTYKVVYSLVKRFSSKYKLAGTENLPKEPCVIVGNHSQIYGPIAGEIYIPGDHYVWCAGQMMHKEEVPDYAFQDFWSGKPKGTHWFYRLLSHAITPLAVLIFNNAHTVPVYHEHNNIVHGFQDKFIDLARFYYKKTKKELDFVPLYVAPRLNTLFFGKPIRFRADAPIAEERARICNALMDGITEIAVNQPEHTVVPYPNIPPSQYPKNIPLEVYTHEQTAV